MKEDVNRTKQEVFLDLPYSVRKVSNLIVRPDFGLDKNQDDCFRTYKLEVMAKNAEGACRILEVVDGQQSVFGAFDLFDQQSKQSASNRFITGTGYYILGEPPRMEIAAYKELTLKEDEVFFIKLELTYPKSQKKQTVDQRYLSDGKSRMPQLEELLAVKNELALLKNSRGWKLLNIVRRAISIVLKPVKFLARK